MHCQHGKICSGCPWIETPWQQQIEQKEQDFWLSWKQAALDLPEDFKYIAIAENELRDRADLVYQNGFASLYQKDTFASFDMQSCPQMSQSLASWFAEFRTLKFPIKKGSLRLRVSPSAKKAVWLDFSHEDIKNLFEEKEILKNLLTKSYVEVGQRRKKLYFDGDRLRLGDPEYHQWTETESSKTKIPLYSLVASFSQSGHKANSMLVSEIQNLADETESKNWVEFGAGSGNLTFPLAANHRKVLALEYDELSLLGLEKTLTENPSYQIQIQAGDFQRKKQIDFADFDGILVNPPRSGLVNFLDPLFETELNKRPQNFIYMSCYKESFVQDAIHLKKLGYKAKKIRLIDQFPQSPHVEILSSWQL